MQSIHILLWRIFVAWCITASTLSHCAPAQKFTMQRDKIDRLCNQFIDQHVRRISVRRWYKIALIAGITITYLIDRGLPSHIKKQQFDLLEDKVLKLEEVIQKTHNVMQGQAIQPALRTIPQYMLQLMSRPVKAVWHVTKALIFTALTQKFISTFVEHLFDPLATTVTLPAGNSWFLQEQVTGAPVIFVFIKEELTKFINTLNALEATLLRAVALKEQSLPLRDEYVHDIVDKGEELIAHINALEFLMSKEDREISQRLVACIERDLIRCLENFCATLDREYNVQQLDEIKDVCLRQVTYVRSIIRPLQALSTYHILPWPISAAFFQEILPRLISI